MKQVQLLSYTYPNHIRLLVKGKVYEYESSEFWCRRLMNCLKNGAQFNALNWFKRVSKLVRKEVIK
jgi:hypothetical protein